jgi:hypothetical protein
MGKKILTSAEQTAQARKLSRLIYDAAFRNGAIPAEDLEHGPSIMYALVILAADIAANVVIKQNRIDLTPQDISIIRNRIETQLMVFCENELARRIQFVDGSNAEAN